MSVRIPTNRMLDFGLGRFRDSESYAFVNVDKMEVEPTPLRLGGAVTYRNSTITVKINRCLANGIRIPVGYLSVQAYVLTEFNGDPSIFIPDAEIDPVGDIIVQFGNVRGLLNTASTLLAGANITQDQLEQ